MNILLKNVIENFVEKLNYEQLDWEFYKFIAFG